MRVNNLIQNNTWVIPEEMLKFVNTEELPILSLEEDKLIWTATQTGEFTIQSAINVIRKKHPKLRWFKRLWKSCVHPSNAGNVWKITRNSFNTDENVKKRGMSLASRCYLCHQDQDLMIHILWDCNYGQLLWSWIGGIFAFKYPISFDDIMIICKNSSPMIQELCLITASNIMVDIWFSRNQVFFENTLPDLDRAKRKLSRMIHECEFRLKGKMSNSAYDLQILNFFDIKCRKVKSSRAIECTFSISKDGDILLCCDGASRGNPGYAGYRFIARDSIGNFVTAESGGLGITTNFVAEIIGDVSSIEWDCRS
ncbi:uncharacterized protein LOC113272340 [Papaver somniferum]|uniref:uncharacterized protein LOC113272340 n=1 Tax=Papaver somniferum TaxID=3469 RepID=UPI000E6F4CB9|nr:uncharacterized protein LOC113272340 [Papaver somniferum]